MTDITAAQICALATFLKGFAPLWETVGGRDRLVFLAPQLIARYKELLRSPDSPKAAVRRNAQKARPRRKAKP